MYVFVGYMKTDIRIYFNFWRDSETFAKCLQVTSIISFFRLVRKIAKSYY